MSVCLVFTPDIGLSQVGFSFAAEQKKSTTMTVQQQAVKLANYNLWANQQIVNWLKAKTDEQLKQEVPSSFPGILKTLNHMWAIEAYWYSVITGDSDVEQRYSTEDLDVNEVFQGLLNRSTLLAERTKQYNDAELLEQVNVKSPWFEADLSRYDYLQHAVNHATYHRGQVVTIGRNAGITDAPMTDLLFFGIMNQ